MLQNYVIDICFARYVSKGDVTMKKTLDLRKIKKIQASYTYHRITLLVFSHVSVNPTDLEFVNVKYVMDYSSSV